MSAGAAFSHTLLLRMHATEAESEGLATFGGGIGSMLPMQRHCGLLMDRFHAGLKVPALLSAEVNQLRGGWTRRICISRLRSANMMRNC